LLRRVAPRDDACYLTPILWALGEYGRALDTGQVALDTAEAQGDAALQVIANRDLGHVRFSVGDYRRAVLRLEASLSSLQDGSSRGIFICRTNRQSQPVRGWPFRLPSKGGG
jgi:hypothetical protein